MPKPVGPKMVFDNRTMKPIGWPLIDVYESTEDWQRRFLKTLKELEAKGK